MSKRLENCLVSFRDDDFYKHFGDTYVTLTEGKHVSVSEVIITGSYVAIPAHDNMTLIVNMADIAYIKH